jgi:macrolide transport system ATP-binding/permease protein
MANGLRSLFRKKRVEEELDEELRGFLDMAAEEKMKQGMSRTDALRAVRLERGSLDVSKEVVQAARWEFFVGTLWQDLRFGARMLRKHPGFTAVAVLTLALGIGANTAIFTLIHAVMLKSLPVANPTQLYRIGDNNNCCVMTGTQNGGSFVLYSYSLYQDLRDHTPEFTDLAAFESYLSDLSVRRGGDPAAEPYKGEFVSGNYFTMFGIRAFTGRLLAPPDDSSAAPRVAVMNYHTWQQHFGLDALVIGSTVNINGVPYTIAGVAPPRFYGDTLRSDPPDFWLPLVAEPNDRLHNANQEWLYLLGRLRPEFPPQHVQARLTVELQEWLGNHREVIPDRDWKDISRQHIRLTSGAGGVGQMQTDYAVGFRYC